jgi:hypothetical protein
VGRQREERELPVDGPDVIPSEVDPAYECVRIGAGVDGEAPAAPPPGAQPEPEGQRLCPEGYVPRRRRRPAYRLEGKRIRPSGPAQRNPAADRDT